MEWGADNASGGTSVGVASVGSQASGDGVNGKEGGSRLVRCLLLERAKAAGVEAQ